MQDPVASSELPFYTCPEREGRFQSAERAVPTLLSNLTTNLLSA